MSAVLGKIHYWLFNQIKIIENRNQFLIKEFTNKYGPEKIKSKMSAIIEKNGGFINDTPLEEALGNQHIHPGLEQLIIKTQTMEASIVRVLIDAFDDEELLEASFYAHGKSISEQMNISAETLDDVLKIFKDIFLERMPCDRLTQIERKKGRVVFKRQQKLHTEFWTDIDHQKMHTLYARWVDGILSRLSLNLEYKRVILEETYEDRIFLK